MMIEEEETKKEECNQVHPVNLRARVHEP